MLEYIQLPSIGIAIFTSGGRVSLPLLQKFRLIACANEAGSRFGRSIPYHFGYYKVRGNG